MFVNFRIPGFLKIQSHFSGLFPSFSLSPFFVLSRFSFLRTLVHPHPPLPRPPLPHLFFFEDFQGSPFFMESSPLSSSSYLYPPRKKTVFWEGKEKNTFSRKNGFFFFLSLHINAATKVPLVFVYEGKHCMCLLLFCARKTFDHLSFWLTISSTTLRLLARIFLSAPLNWWRGISKGGEKGGKFKYTKEKSISQGYEGKPFPFFTFSGPKAIKHLPRFPVSH